MPLPPIEDHNWDAVRESMRMLATAMNKMRRTNDDLLVRIKLLEAAQDSTESTVLPLAPAPGEGVTGVFIPVPHCLMCKQEKEAGRIELTCKPCGRLRHAIITQKGDRTQITHTECLNCGKHKGANTKMLCPPCSEAFKAYKMTRA